MFNFFQIFFFQTKSFRKEIIGDMGTALIFDIITIISYTGIQILSNENSILGVVPFKGGDQYGVRGRLPSAIKQFGDLTGKQPCVLMPYNH